ncbi:MAG: amidohydrolase family protein [Syntrophorhabdales bacterium]|jgi:predicted TIM-barrel fold metal-dependent hydrolase
MNTSGTDQLKIDVFNHVLPKKYKDALDKAAPHYGQKAHNDNLPTLWDMDHRFRIMDKYPGLMHVLTVSRPPIEEAVANPKKALDLTRLANDEVAELVATHPNRFPAGIAAVALNDLEGSLKELERALTELKFRGVQLYTDLNGKPLDSPEFMPVYEIMARHDLPIFLHPTTGITETEYKTEDKPKYITPSLFGWPYETTMALARLVFGGVLERWPNLKVVTHHAGGMIAFYEQRIIAFLDEGERLHKGKRPYQLIKAPIDYFKMFYADTAIYGSTPGLVLASAFFGLDHMLFATDAPFSGWFGERVTRQTIASIERMEITEEEKRGIFEENARKLMHLPV